MKVARIFGSGMVLQRDKEIRIWGWGSPNERIVGILSTDQGQETHESRVNKGGEWSLVFGPHKAQYHVSLTIQGEREHIGFDNIKLGEVWLAGGQSNMAYPLRYDSDRDEAFQADPFPEVYYYDCPKISFEGQEVLYDYSYAGFWRPSSPEDLAYFSAVAYYFAKELENDLNIPIGIIGCNWDGTLAASWIDPSYLKDNGGRVWLDWYDALTKNLDMEQYKQDFLSNPENNHDDPVKRGQDRLVYPGLTKDEQDQYMEGQSMEALMEGFEKMIGPYSSQRPGGLYDTMISKIAPYSIRGVLWYQGESDSRIPEVYDQVLEALIKNWRDLWKDQITFLIVQLAPFKKWLFADGNNFPIIRKMQDKVTGLVAGTWLASSSDAGMEWDIHPKSKKVIGERLALLAKDHVYDQGIIGDPPEFKEAKRLKDGILLSFNHARSLCLEGETINAFKFYGSDGSELDLRVDLIEPNQIMIRCKTTDWLHIKFAMTPYYHVNIYNEYHNPMKPFDIQVD